MNSVQRTQKQYAKNKLHMERMLQWTPLCYAEFQWQMMDEYIGYLTGGDLEGFELYSKSEVFRKWWVNQWNVRDMLNVETVEGLVWTNDRRAFYREVHSLESLITNARILRMEGQIVGRVLDELLTNNK